MGIINTGWPTSFELCLHPDRFCAGLHRLRDCERLQVRGLHGQRPAERGECVAPKAAANEYIYIYIYAHGGGEKWNGDRLPHTKLDEP
jgi:hypothetical protein